MGHFQVMLVNCWRAVKWESFLGPPFWRLNACGVSSRNPTGFSPREEQGEAPHTLPHDLGGGRENVTTPMATKKGCAQGNVCKSSRPIGVSPSGLPRAKQKQGHQGHV